MSIKDKNPFLKKASGAKPPNRREIRRGLGKGLDGLISAPTSASSISAPKASSVSSITHTAPSVNPAVIPSALEVPIMDIARSPYQPRRDFKEEELKELAQSIRENGIIQPPTVRKLESGNYELIAGERRLRAAQLAGLTKVKVTLVKATDEEAAAMTATENLQREDLNPIEEGESYRMLIDRFNYTQEQVAEKVGKSRPVIANATRLLELPEEVKHLIAGGLLSTGHAKVLLSLEDDKDRVLFAREIVNDGLTVRALEKKIAKRLAPPVERKSSAADMPLAHVKALTDELRKTFGCAVRLTPSSTLPNGRRAKGLLEIDFVNNDDLDRILEVMGVKLN